MEYVKRRKKNLELRMHSIQNSLPHHELSDHVLVLSEVNNSLSPPYYYVTFELVKRIQA